MASKIYWTEALLRDQRSLLADRMEFCQRELDAARSEVQHFDALIDAVKEGRTVVSIIPDRPTGKVRPTISEDS